MALADPVVSKQFYDAVQSSPWNENKIELQSFLKTAAGRALIRAVALAAKVPSKQIQTRLGALRSTDMYLPFDEHREFWKGTPTLTVGMNRDGAFNVLRSLEKPDRNCATGEAV